MKCPRCGSEMTIDSHRKIPLPMCYNCGYIEGRNAGQSLAESNTNYEHLKTLGFNEMVAFLSAGLKLPADQVSTWLDNDADGKP